MAGGGRAARIAALGMLALVPQPAAHASGVDGAGRLMVLPLAFTGRPRESVVTLTNPNSASIKVASWYVGAEGTPNAASARGTIECAVQSVPAHGSVTLLLRELCPDASMPDRENFGYVWLVSQADGRANFFVTTVVEAPSVGSGIAGQPVGAFDPGFATATSAGLEVGGLRTRKAKDESPICYLGALGEPKRLTLDLQDPTGASLGTTMGVTLAASSMVRIDLEASLGLPALDRDGLRLVLASTDDTLVIAGCGAEHRATETIAYQPAQAAAPADRSRLHSVRVEAELHPGPYFIGAPWVHTKTGGPADRKIVLSTYLRSDDEVRCVLEPWVQQQPPGYDTTPWIELRMVDPLGAVVGGGSGAKDTGVVRTRSRGTYPAGVTQRYTIEISFDESAPLPWPNNWPGPPVLPGGWQVACVSAAGMSEPVPVFVELLDDF
jgi:hypothetical protein